MSIPALEQQFEQRRGQLPGSADRRREALAAFLAKGFPTRRDEAWRYTDLKPIAASGFELAPPGPSEASRSRVRALLAEVAAGAEDGTPPARAVFVDGRLDDTLSQLDPVPGLAVVNLAADWERFDAPDRRNRLEGHPLAQLNRAFARDGVAIRVSAGTEIHAPLELFLAGSGETNLAPQPRIAIELERGAALTVVVHCLDAGGSANWLNLVIDVVQAEGSRLTLHRLQEHGPESFHTSLLAADLAKDASLEVGYVDLGARLARNDIDVKLNERGANATVFGVFLASPGQHIDDHIRIEHAAPHTTSDTAFRGIADTNGHGVFNGKVLVQRDAQGIDARQTSDNLLLADRAEIDTKPELEIYADDVKCSHGATVGELDSEQLFYLRSRGIDEAAARGLLTFAFANSLLRRLGPAWLRERATSKVAGRLPDQNRWESLA